MTIDSDAFQTIQRVAGLTPAEQQYLLTVARGEGFYGLGWGNTKAMSYQQTTLPLSVKFGIDPLAGVGSHNWGAIQGTGPAGSFPHIDRHADGTPYVGKYKKYNNDVEGAADMARIIFKPNLRAALATGIYKGNRVEPIRAAAFTQHDNGYFQLNPELYLKAVLRNYTALATALNWPPLLTRVVEEATPENPLAPTGQPSQPSAESLPSSGSFPPPDDESDECPNGEKAT